MVTDGAGDPIAGALVRLTGAGQVREGYTNAGGAVDLTATQYRISGTNHRADTTIDREEITPHTLSVTADGFGAHTSTVTMDAPRQQTVILE